MSSAPLTPAPQPPGSPQPGASGELFTYFSAIEQRFNERRGSLLLLSTLDWALIETWREAGVPVEAVLRGIDQSFDRFEARSQRAQSAAARSRLRKVNGLAWCAQAVMEAAGQMVEASTGLPANTRREAAESGFEPERVAAFLERNAAAVAQAQEDAATRENKSTTPDTIPSVLDLTAGRLRELADSVRGPLSPPLDDVDRTLTLLEERLVAALHLATPEAELASLTETADRELGPARARLGALQSRRVRDQFVHKRLLERHRLPRLSLFYMGPGE